jgi:quinohemoprotein ethanol dehydrogenase
MIRARKKLPPVRLITLCLCWALGACEHLPTWTGPAAKDWPTHGGNLEDSRYSALRQINVATVSRLGGAWVTDLDHESSVAAPIVIDGVMFLTAGTHVDAIDARNGKILWSYKPENAAPDRRGVAAGEGLIFAGLSNTRVVALDMKTGELKWTSDKFGADPPVRTGITAAPIYANGVVVAGLLGSELKPGTRASVVGLDAKTGRKLWQFYTIPGPGELGHETWPQDNDSWKVGSGSVWTSAVVDPRLDLVYFGVGNAVPQFGGEVRAGDNLFVASAVALDLKTGQYRWHFQTIHHDLWDADAGTPLILYDAVVDGKTRPAIAVMRTDGYMFLLDRRTGKPVFPVEERPEKQNTRLKTAPTQPYPVGADQVGPNCAQKNLIPAGFEVGCFWDPVDFDQPNVMFPAANTRFAPMTYDPKTGLFYVPGGVRAYWYRRTEDPWSFMLATNTPTTKVYGLITALDARTMKIVWEKKLPLEIVRGSGITSTAGGLLFHGEVNGSLQAYDARTGDLKWEFQTGDQAQAPVITYEVEGEQYVALAATSSIWAFKLGGNVAQRPAKAPQPTELTFAGRVTATDKVTIAGPSRDVVGNPIYDEYMFDPARTTVDVGATVTWTNDGKEPHDATALDGSWTTGVLQPHASVTLKFSTPGTYTYICKGHPWTYGQLIVKEATRTAKP